MTNYIKGFSVSLFLHGAVLFLALWFTLGNAGTDKKMLLVDFSTITLGQPNEGGALRGMQNAVAQGPGSPVSSVLEKHPASPPEKVVAPPVPEPLPKPEPIVTPQPESVVTPKSKPRDKLKPVSSPSTTKRTEPRQPRQPNAAQAQPSVVGSGAGGDGEIGSNVPAGSETGRGIGTGNGTGTGQGLAQGYVKNNFNYILISIRRNLEYPDYARRKKLTGTAHFAFLIKQDGTIENLRLEKSSGHSILDEAAQKAIQRAAPFPRPPVPALLVVPISFRLG